MSFLLSDISSAFGVPFVQQKGEETFSHCLLEYTASAIIQHDVDVLETVFAGIFARDRFELELTLGHSVPITFQSTSGTLGDFATQVQNQIQYYTQGELVTLKLMINKCKEGAVLSVYNTELFEAFLTGLTAEDFLCNFAPHITGEQHLIFQCMDLQEKLTTASIHFLPTDGAAAFTYQPSFTRQDVLGKIQSCNSFSFPQALEIVPQDFLLVQRSSQYLTLQLCFDRVVSLLLITCLFDITKVSDDQLTYKLNGYKSITGTLLLKAPLASLPQYAQIFQWVFEGGNLVDKIGLARNILSLHLSAKDLELSAETYSSVISSHKVYEKQNIKQYVELRNKITDQIYNYTDKANKIIETFASGFQKSAVAFVSLFSTIVITKVLTTKNFKDIFSYDATVVSLLFLAGSLIYFFVSLWEVNAQLKRFTNSYQSMKARNSDLLNDGDINRILNNDAEHHNDTRFIKNKRLAYSIMWMLFFGLFLTATLVLHNKYAVSHPEEGGLFREARPQAVPQEVKKDSVVNKPVNLPFKRK